MDVDTGVDDALAILMTLSMPRLQVVGFSTAAGNTSARQAALNTRFLLNTLGVDLPIHVGREQSFDGRPVDPVPGVHGRDGLGEITGDYWSRHGRDPRLQPGAAEAIVRAARTYGPDLHLLATGPATNVALALGIDPEAMSRIGQLIWMGGSLDEGGNITPYAEFNAHADPRAAQVVLAAGLPTTVIPLDVTHRVRLMAADLAARTDLDHNLCGLLRDMTRLYMRFHREHWAFEGSFMHDCLTVAALVRRDLFTFRRCAMRVVTEGEQAGRTVWSQDSRDAPSTAAVDVATAVDPPGCLELFWAAMARCKTVRDADVTR